MCVCLLFFEIQRKNNKKKYKRQNIMSNQGEIAKEVQNEVNAAENELTEFVDKLLKQMHEKFEDMSTSVNQRLDNLGGKIDEIEKSITDLINEIGNEEVEI